MGEFTFWNGPELVAKLRVSIEEFWIGVAYHMPASATCWQKHECGCSLCVKDGRRVPAVNGRGTDMMIVLTPYIARLFAAMMERAEIPA
eukprot:336931-Pelagomonas_calceolata.AAC.1